MPEELVQPPRLDLPSLQSQAPFELFALECTFTEGMEVCRLPLHTRRLVHCLGPNAGSCIPFLSHLVPMCVGRAFQAEVFDLLSLSEEACSTISREHFRIDAREVADAEGGDGGRAFCGVDFTLTNLSGNGTQVNQ